MKAIAVALMTVAGAVLVATPAVAAPPTAADLAADCNDDGVVLVSGVGRYVGGTGVITGPCVIELAPAGSKLVLRGVELSGPGFLALNTGFAGSGSSVRVVDTTIDIDGVLELTPGANAGDPGVPDGDVKLVVKRSKLRASHIQLATSLDWPNGRTIVRESELTATAGPIRIEASVLAGTGGTARVVNSTLTATDDVTVVSGDAGRTVVRASSVAAGGSVSVTSGAGGRCRTAANTPPLACS